MARIVASCSVISTQGDLLPFPGSQAMSHRQDVETPGTRAYQRGGIPRRQGPTDPQMVALPGCHQRSTGLWPSRSWARARQGYISWEADTDSRPRLLESLCCWDSNTIFIVLRLWSWAGPCPLGMCDISGACVSLCGLKCLGEAPLSD
ncbi:hypothetical protein RRG08_011897 [Elysia crispata]|uniref:Uncharacterized protein n=1 Tax=Elysia crispata TaxID=231223 RepID=A0AAE0ZM69_9GAST|nr:hypothetical protein RRG08_011897 [Elysia crispata]